MSTRMQQRRGTAEQWTTVNPVLAEGELGWESDTNQFKIGDGVNNWANLEYFQDAASVTASLSDYVEVTSLGVANGVATLDATGNVPINQLGNIIDGAPGVLDTLNELAAALNDDPSFFTNISSTITSGDSATLTSANAYADGLAVNYDAVGSADAAEAAANLYTDGEILALDTSLKTYADTAESDAITAANAYADGLAVNYDSVGSADAAEAAANAYTDSLVGDVTVDGTAGNTVTDRIATAVAGIVDTAPEALNTLNELAAALGDDPNFATTIATQIGGKADTVHTHAISDVTNLQTTLDGKAASSHTHAISDVTNLQTTLDAKAASSHTHSLADVTDVTATAAEVNVLDGITATTTELNYTDGVTSNIQTQLNAKQATITGGATTITGSDLTTSRALVSDGSGKVAVSAVTSTELGYLDGVTSAVQTQLNGKVSTSNGTVSTASTSSTVVRNITLSTANPSGGVDGQVWLKYTN